MRATLSLLGLYKYDNTIFEKFHIPDGIDKNTLVNNLLLETAEMEILYPSATVIKNAIDFWSSKQLPIWEKLYKTTVLEYNPIWNKDSLITETEKNTGSSQGTRENTTNRNDKSVVSDSTETSNSENYTGNSNSNSSANGTSDNFVSGFNSDTMVQKDRTATTNTEAGSANSTSTVESNGNIDRDSTTTNTASGTEKSTSTGSDTRDRVLEHKEQGNIGVTTTQEMIEEERKVAVFNIIDFIINDFIKRFCLLVY